MEEENNLKEKKKFWDGDKVMSVSAILVSLMTLFIFLYQTRLMKEQSRLMVMPRMGMNQSMSSTDTSFTFIMSASNDGLGPAILDSVRILYEGKKWPADFEGFFEQNLPDLVKFLDQSTFISDGGMHPNGISRIYFKFVATNQGVDKLLSILNKLETEKSIDILIYFSSIYNERWMMNLFSETSTPIPLK